VEIREACDQGHPIVLTAPDSVVSRAYGNIAEKVVKKLKQQQFQPEIIL
jgi:ATP-binding protein involved in chromosome partitioning